MTVQPRDRGHRREWTLAEIDAMEQAGRVLRPDYLDRLQRLSDTEKLNNRTPDGELACAFGTPWLDHWDPPTGTGKGCEKCEEN